MSRPISVVVVEDSPTQAAHIKAMLEQGGEFAVVAIAADARAAISEVADRRPDAVTMDLELPGGGGQFAIEQIMQASPSPILLFSHLAVSTTSLAAVDALGAGAVDVLAKPAHWTADDADRLRRRVRLISAVPVVRRRLPGSAARPRGGNRASSPLVALAASTGGPPALAAVLAGMGELTAPVLIVQHIHPNFVDGLAELLAGTGSPVSLGRHGERLEPGRIYLAGSGAHLKLGPGRRLEVDPEPQSLHRPSADVLFESVARHAGPAAVAALLTGMGRDGATGLRSIRQAGGMTVAQDKASSAVFGMPGVAQRIGAASAVLPVHRIGPAIALAVKRRQP